MYTHCYIIPEISPERNYSVVLLQTSKDNCGFLIFQKPQQTLNMINRVVLHRSTMRRENPVYNIYLVHLMCSSVEPKSNCSSGYIFCICQF